MPNWCNSDLVVRGDKDEVERFILFARSEQSVFDFNNFIKMPKECDWYLWATNNWGTKWNSCQAEITKSFISKHGRQRIKIEFTTAWRPCLPVILAASELFPDLSFELRYFESGCAFKGIFTAKNGCVGKDILEHYSGPKGG